MKQYTPGILNTKLLAYFLLAIMMTTQSCRKEMAIEPTNLDENYFVVNDNPNDPIDHLMYEFYKNTGIACFYNDTISKKQISKDGEVPARYAYTKLSLEYAPLGKSYVYFDRLTSKSNIPAFLTLLQEEVIPKLPSNLIIPSIFLIDSLGLSYPSTNILISQGWTAQYGFNTIGIAVKNVTAMSSEERRVYAASILAGIAVKRISERYAGHLQKEFFSISREAVKNLIPVDVYLGYPYLFMLSPDIVPQPEEIGFLFHGTFLLGDMAVPSTPRESDDIRAFLTAAFCYTNQKFSERYDNATHVLQKFGIIRSLLRDVGFNFPD